MPIDYRRGVISLFALTAPLWAVTPQAAAESVSEFSLRITELCLSRHVDDAACDCLSQETGSRFEPDQLQIIAAAMEAREASSEISAGLLAQGMSEAEVASFVHRLETAHIVIGQTCGTSFFEPLED